MTPKHLALAAALATPALATPVVALAQSSLTIYGIADVGVRHSTGMTAANAPSSGSVSSVASGVNNTSRFGLRGREDLGGGLHALFNLETGLNLDTGSPANANKFFDRASTVGLGGDWGQVTAGAKPTCWPMPSARWTRWACASPRSTPTSPRPP